MPLLHKEESKQGRITRLLGLPMLSKLKLESEDKVEYLYKILGLPIYKKSQPSLRARLSDLKRKLDKVEILVEMLWLARLQGQSFNGQIGQDALAYALLKDKQDGFFVDIGAHDGISLSNSYLFEKLGWRGICIEANPRTFATLQQNRQCNTYNLAIYSKNIGHTNLTISSSDCSVLDTLEVNLTSTHRERMQGYGALEKVSVPTATFDEVMQNHPEVSHVDFLSLDVEGGELEVLRGIDFDKHSFGVMTIEHNHTESKELVRQFLEERGYRALMQNSFDMMFVKDLNICFGRV